MTSTSVLVPSTVIEWLWGYRKFQLNVYQKWLVFDILLSSLRYLHRNSFILCFSSNYFVYNYESLLQINIKQHFYHFFFVVHVRNVLKIFHWFIFTMWCGKLLWNIFLIFPLRVIPIKFFKFRTGGDSSRYILIPFSSSSFST